MNEKEIIDLEIKTATPQPKKMKTPDDYPGFGTGEWVQFQNTEKEKKD